MRTMMSLLIALSVLASVVASADAATRDDEYRGDFWRYQNDMLP